MFSLNEVGLNRLKNHTEWFDAEIVNILNNTKEEKDKKIFALCKVECILNEAERLGYSLPKTKALFDLEVQQLNTIRTNKNVEKISG